MKTLVRTMTAALLLSACGDRVEFQRKDWDRADLGRGLSRSFLLGTATAAHQIEGGNTNSWTTWESEDYPDGTPHIDHGDQSGLASGSWGHFEDRDLPLMEQLGANAYRLSVEWSRLEPAPGQWDAEAAKAYLDFVTLLRSRGIEPMVTLHHFTLPSWFEERGGFEKRENLPAFADFTRRVAELLGGQVDLWCTVNEPNVYAVNGYIEGIWPPGKKDSALGAEVLANLLEAHALAAVALRETDTTDADGDGRATLVGLAHHVRVFQPATSSTLDGTISALTDDFFNESTVQAAATGRIRISVPPSVNIDRAVEGLKGSFDYLGVNYYTRDHVRADLSRESLSVQYVPDDRPKNDLGWDIYPEGLYTFLKRFSAFGWPIYITENGIADNDGDLRADFLKMHLYAMERAISEGVDVRGYFHWSLIDNFEWSEGFEPRFGLYTVDYADPERTRCPTPGAQTFREVAVNLGHAPPALVGCP